MTSRRRKPSDGKRPRPYIHEKKAFCEDADCDPTLTGVEKAILAVVAKNFDNEKGSSECAYTFLARGAGTTKKVAIRYMRQLVAKGRVFLVKKGGAGQDSNLWGVHWNFRGSAMVREASGGNPVVNIIGPRAVTARGPQPVTPDGDVLGTSRGPQPGTESLFISLRENKDAIGAPGASPLRAAPVAMAAWRLVEIVATELKLVRGDNYLLAELAGVPGGEPHGKITICLEASDKGKQDDGQEQFGTLRRVLGLSDIEALDELHGIPFLYRPPWGLIPDPANEAAMENPDWYAIARGTGVEKQFRKLRDLDEIRLLLTPAMHKLAAKHEPMREAA